MQQINENLVVCSVGDQMDESAQNYLKIYLSGTIDLSGDPKYDWQNRFIGGMAKLVEPSTGAQEFNQSKYMILNPKMPIQNPDTTTNNPEFVNKMNWELPMMQQADVIFCNFLKKSKSTFALQGLLLNSQSQGKVIVRCPSEYSNYSYVKILCDFYSIPVLGETANVNSFLQMCYNMVPKFKETAYNF